MKRRRTLPLFAYPSSRDENFKLISEAAMAGRVPRLFWSDGFIAYNLKRVLIIADYDLIVKMFKDPNVSARLTTPKGYLAQKYERISRGLEVELEALGMKEGTNYGLASGIYDQVRSLVKCKISIIIYRHTKTSEKRGIKQR